jgi:hypothetical protein
MLTIYYFARPDVVNRQPRDLRLVRGSLVAGESELSKTLDIVDPRLYGFSTILSGTSIDLFQKLILLRNFLNLRRSRLGKVPGSGLVRG